MDFKDFIDNPNGLLGKNVLYEYGMSYSTKRSFLLVSIVKVTKTGFRIFGMPDSLFSLIDGRQKWLTGRMDMATVSQCRLLTIEEHEQIKEKWARDKEENSLRERMKIKFESMSFEQLKKMELL